MRSTHCEPCHRWPLLESVTDGPWSFPPVHPEARLDTGSSFRPLLVRRLVRNSVCFRCSTRSQEYSPFSREERVVPLTSSSTCVAPIRLRCLTLIWTDGACRS